MPAIRGAVLDQIGVPRPYWRSKPISVVELHLDPPDRGEVLVRIEAAGVCHSDLSVVDGTRVRPVPILLGHEAAGIVEQVGDGVDGVAMGTRFLLTSDSTVPDAVKRRYLQAGLDGTVVTTRVDGMPHRVLRTELVEKLESGSRARGFAAALRNAGKFRRMSQMTWRSMIRDGLTMRHGKELTWSQVLMAANTPMLLKAGLVDGNTEAGVLASGQVAGILDDLPSCKELIESIVLDAITHLQTASALVE